MPTVVLTQPTSIGIPGTILSDITIPPLTTIITDTCICGNNMSVKWIYTLMDSVAEDVLTAEVVANHRYGNNPRWNRYGLVGDRMLHSLEVQLNVNNLELRITNNHPTNTYRANIVRIEMLA
jgi:hypothetical protein